MDITCKANKNCNNYKNNHLEGERAKNESRAVKLDTCAVSAKVEEVGNSNQCSVKTYGEACATANGCENCLKQAAEDKSDNAYACCNNDESDGVLNRSIEVCYVCKSACKYDCISKLAEKRANNSESDTCNKACNAVGLKELSYVRPKNYCAKSFEESVLETEA